MSEDVKIMLNQTFFFFFCEAERQIQIPEAATPIHWLTHQKTVTIQAGTQPKSLTWMADTQLPEPSPTASEGL